MEKYLRGISTEPVWFKAVARLFAGGRERGLGEVSRELSWLALVYSEGLASGISTWLLRGPVSRVGEFLGPCILRRIYAGFWVMVGECKFRFGCGLEIVVSAELTVTGACLAVRFGAP